MNFIHPTAVIHPDAKIGDNNNFGPFCYIGPDVEIGNYNRFEGYCSVGSQPEHKAYFSNGGKKVIIGTGNVIREFVTINMGTERNTVMGNHCIMLRGSHLSHDSVLEDHVTVSCNVLIGGHSLIMKGANLGLGSIIHQHQIIGAYSMLGMGAVVTKSQTIESGKIYAGNPAKYLKDNTIGIERAGLTPEELKELRNKLWRLKGIPI